MSKKEPTQAQLDALKPHQFKPGESGNPSGKPKGETITSLLRKKLDEEVEDKATGKKVTIKELVVQAIVKKAAQGDQKLIRELLDRTEGKVTQGLEIGGPGGGPMIVRWETEPVAIVDPPAIEDEPHTVEDIHCCEHCGKEWTAVYPSGIKEIECPGCNKMSRIPLTLVKVNR